MHIPLVYIIPRVDDVENTTRFQRIFHLAKAYRLTVICMQSCEPPLKLSSKARWVVYGGNKLLFPLWVMSVIKEGKYEAILTSHLPISIVSGFLSRKVLRVPWVADMYDMPTLSSDTKLISKLLFPVIDWAIGFCLRNTDHVLATLAQGALSKYHIDEKKISYFTNGTVVHPGNGGKSQRDFDERLTVLYVGHVLLIRGLDIIVDAAKLCIGHGVNLDWVLVGPSSKCDERWLQSKLKEHDLDNIRYVGAVAHKRALEYIKDADICLCPFKRTSGTEYIYPVKIFEYMDCGKAIVSTDLIGIRSIMTHDKDGILIAPDDAKALADAVLRLAQDQELRLKLEKHCKESVVQYDWETIHCKILNCLEGCFGTEQSN